MSEPFVAQITMFGFNFAPKGWAMCAGQLLPISQNTALFSLLGTMYGGDGKSNFALPNLQGQAAISAGQGAGLSQYFQGETVGAPTITLPTSEMPQHNHHFMATSTAGTAQTSAGNQLAQAFSGSKTVNYTGNYLSTNAPNTSLSLAALTQTGSNAPHNNLQPYLAINFCIAMQGVYPPRS